MGTGWHSLRRKFATEMTHVLLKEPGGHLGGWKTEQTILERCQQPDKETMKAAQEQRRTSARRPTGRPKLTLGWSAENDRPTRSGW